MTCTARIASAALFSAFLFWGCRQPSDATDLPNARPNILFVIADDQSYPDASVYGAGNFHTPAFDSVAARGVLFTSAFVAAPQCSPSRAAILTGRNIWRLEEAGTHSSYFPKKFTVITDVLEAAGYSVGFTGKGWGPGNWKDAGWKRNPAGTEFNERLFESVPATGISKVDYAGNFEDFLKEKPGDKPFFFWFGSHEPHRAYEYGSGRKAFPNEGKAHFPKFLPEDDTIATDWLDYAMEISWYDRQLSKILDLLRRSGQLDKTIVVVTADNGMPFPYAKANLQEYGIHVPLAICGPGIKGGRRVDDLVSLVDLAPTFAEVAGLPPMKQVSGQSLLPILKDDGKREARAVIYAGRERHTHARPDNVGYPARAIRTKQYLFIWNIKADRWPAGDPPPVHPSPDVSPDLSPIQVGYEDVDDSPTKRIMLRRKDHWPREYDLAFAKRPAEELYDIQADPECLRDLAGDPLYTPICNDLRKRLLGKLREEGDPRVSGNGDIFESYPRFGKMRPFNGFHERGVYNPAFQVAPPTPRK
jgi:uncharacterized sulfatase